MCVIVPDKPSGLASLLLLFVVERKEKTHTEVRLTFWGPLGNKMFSQ